MNTMKKLFSRFPLTFYYLLAIAFMILLGAPQMILFPKSLAYSLMFGQWGPALAAIIVVLFLSGKDGVRNLLSSLSIRRATLKYSGIAIIIPILLCSLAYVVLSFISFGKWQSPDLPRSLSNYLICLIATIFSVTGEEIGWRGFMLPKMMEKYSLFTSSFLTGLLWGVWHFRFQSIGLAVFYILTVIDFSFISSWLFIKTKGNITASIIFHATINMCSLVLFEKILLVSNSQASLQLNTLLYGIYAILFAIPAIFIAFQFKKDTTTSIENSKSIRSI